MLTIEDTIGRNLNFKNTPQKIISLSPEVTGLLSELSLESKIIGITNQCTQPYYLKSTKVIVGEEKAPILEKIEALQPNIIFCNNNSLTEDILQKLEEIAPVYIYQINSLQEAKNFLVKISSLLKCKTESTQLIEKLEFKIDNFQNFIQSKTIHKIAFFVDTWKSIKMTPYLSEMLQLNKFENIYQDLKELDVNIRKIRYQGDPTVILLATDQFDFEDEHAFEVGEYANRSATVFVDSNVFCKFGAHTLKAFDYFKKMHQRLESHF